MGACPGLTPCPPEGILESLKIGDTEILKPAMIVGLMTVGTNLVTYVGNRLAYELATTIATGGRGQAPLVNSKSLADSWGTFGLDVVGETLGSLDELNLDDQFGVNFSLCAPSNPLLKLNLAIGIKQAYQPKKPKCDFATVAKNWEATVASIASIGKDPTGEAMKALAGSLRPGSNELSFAIQTTLLTQQKVAEKKAAEVADYQSSEGFKAVTDAVTGQVKTPAALVKEATTFTYTQKDKDGVESTKEIIQNPEWGKLGIGVGLSVLNTFVNTLLTGGMNSLSGLLKEGLIPTQMPGDPMFPELASPNDVKERLAAKFGGVKTANPFAVTNYDVMSEFTVCPSGGSLNRGVNNCVMDTSFLSAVTRAQSGEPLTVRQAVAEGLLHGDWPLIAPTDTSRNQDPLCYTYGYCYGNLAKLRKARIISIGWEIAAGLSTPQSPITLQRALDAFDKCETAPELCHLVDPDWILMYPESQCRATANGEVLSVKDSASRAASCVDVQSCVSRRADGSCEAFGYCVSEKNVWKFKGESCPLQFASCMTFANKTGGKSSSFLLNTVDYGTCAETNAGCLWYALTKTVNTKGTPAVTADDTYDWDGGTASATEKRIYLNGKAELCSAAEAGCTQLYTAASLRLNMVANPDLEDDVNADNLPDSWYWTAVPAGQYVKDSQQGFLGSIGSVRPSATSKLAQDGIVLTPGAFHTLSVYLKGTDAGDAVQLKLTKMDGTTPANVTGTNFSSNTCTRNGSTYAIKASNGSAVDYVRFSCTFAAPPEPTLASVSFVNGVLAYDAIQLEVGEVATNFIQKGYDQPKPASTYLRVAPAYLGCTGAVTDRPECKNYAQSCSAQDVGCSLYKPADGGPDVPATATKADQCPNECVGYAAYKQTASLYEQAKFPVSFIPTAAKSCDVANAGCDSFTNLDSVAKGGEGVEYYTSLRACSKPEDTTQARTYFTWEGSDAAGYQLRTWQLLQTTVVGSTAPCTSWAVENGGTAGAPKPVIRCVENAAPAALGCAAHADIFTNPDCREFYDEAGTITYRLFSKTITVSAECAPYRKTVALETDCRATGGLWTAAGECRYLGIAKESNSCPAAANGCRAYTGGAGNNVRTVMQETFEPPAFQAANVNGVGGANPVQTSESVATGGHSLGILNAPAGGGFGGSLTGMVTVGKTYAFDFWAKGNGEVQAAFVQMDGTVRPIGAPVTVTGDWKSFSVGPVDTAVFSGFDDRATLRMTLVTAGSFYVDNIRLTESQDTIGIVKNSWTIPASCDRGPGTDGTPGTGAVAPQYYLGCKAYTEAKSGTKASFYQFTRLCSEQTVGCQAFFNTRNSKAPEGHVYNAVCKAAAQTATGTSCTVGSITYCTIPKGQTTCSFEYATSALPASGNGFTISAGPDTRVVGNDAPVYLVDNGAASCTEASLGCQEVGKPIFNQDRSAVVSYETTYLFDRPDEYKDTLCAETALFCAAWGTQTNGTFFFKDPGEQTCDYRTDVKRTGDNRLYTGWFRKGTTEPCAPDNIRAGDQYGIWKNGDVKYADWVGQCENKYDLCTEYIDTTDTTAVTDKGQSYPYLAKGSLSATEADTCNGQVSQRAGCVLLNNTNILDLPFAAGPSYVASTHADALYGGKQNELRNPISCDTATSGVVQKPDGSSVNLCNLRCSYNVGANRNLRTGLRVEGPGGNELVGACLTSADCPVMETETGRKVSGTCVDVAAPASATNPVAYGPQYALKNDSNLVRSVIRDRACAEWLSCQSSYSAWDADNNKYVPICEQVRLYRDFKNGQHVDPVQDVSVEPISVQAYMSRNLSWYGLDYAGYTIPGAVPVPAIKHLNVSPVKWCFYNGAPLTVPATGAPRACSVPGDCATPAGATCEPATSDYREVVVVGTCDENAGAGRGGDCHVGSCKATGNRCNQDGDCGAGDTCQIGYCQEDNGRTCTKADNSECATPGATDRVCDTSRGRCVDLLVPTLKCSSNNQCNPKQTCKDYPGSRTGACFNNLCLTDYRDQNGDGRADPLKADAAEPLSCRGYPEISSPFPQQVVSTWKDYEESASKTRGKNESLVSESAAPFTYVKGFDQLPVCAPILGADGKYHQNNDCLCSYTKVAYGEGAMTKYFSTENAKNLSLDKGVCMGGTSNGATCTVGSACAGNGTCQFPTRQDTKIGWEGYCLEYDTSIQLFGSQSEADRPCLTWFPTDSVKGATDLFGKDLQAGYYSGKDDVYCAETDVYYNVYSNVVSYTASVPGNASVNVEYATACAEAGNANTDACNTGSMPQGKIPMDRIKCPENFFAVVTGCGPSAPFVNSAVNPAQASEEEPRLCGTGNAFADDKPWYLSRNPTIYTAGWDQDDSADFPFICVPKLSFRKVAEAEDAPLEPCLPPGRRLENVRGNTEADYGSPIAGATEWTEGTRTVYQVSASEFNKARTYYAGCAVKGLTQSELFRYIPASDLQNNVYGVSYGDGSSAPGYGRPPSGSPEFSVYYNNEIKTEAYLGCKNLVQTSSTVVGAGGRKKNAAQQLVFNIGWTDRLWNQMKNNLPRYTVSPFGYTAYTERSVFGQSIPVAEYQKNFAGKDAWPQYADQTPPLEHPSYEAPIWELAGIAGLTTCEFDHIYDTLTCAGGIGIGRDVEIAGGGLNTVSSGEGSNGTQSSYGSFIVGDDEQYKVRPLALGGKYCTVVLNDTLDQVSVNCDTSRDGELCVVHGQGDPVCTSVQNQGTENAGLTPTYEVTKQSLESPSAALERLKGLFLQAVGVWQWEAGLPQSLGGDITSIFRSYLEGTGENDPHLGRYVRKQVGAIEGVLNGIDRSGYKAVPPKVASIGACGNDGCKEGKEGRFSVDGLESGTIQGADGQKSVNVSFFAWADSEQMPLRRVLVDWGDGYLDSQVAEINRTTVWPTNSQTGSTSDDNFYKNRRGLDASGDKICDITKYNSFGHSAQACEQGYVNFTHDYVCSGTVQKNLPACQIEQATGRLLNAPCTGGVPNATGKCVYQPRVQAVDNWGWCTGTCTFGPDGTNQCFGGECSNAFPNAQSTDRVARESNPWVYYSGYVLVEPSK